MSPRFLAIWALAVVLGGTALGQSTLYTIDGSPNTDFGLSVSGVGDVNNDGIPDFVAARGRNWEMAEVFSGSNGSVIYTFNDSSSWPTSGGGDVDGDGTPDIILGAGNNGSGGAVEVRSGRTGALLYRFWGTSGDGFGIGVGDAGDVNMDGYADVIVGVPLSSEYGTWAGKALVFSGRTGAGLYTFYGDSPGGFCGLAVSGAGDVNKDGYADVIVGEPWRSNFAGRARVFSGKTGAVLYQFIGAPTWYLGHGVSDAGDLDQDGNDDFLIQSSVAVTAYSGRTGTSLWSFSITNPYVNFGTQSMSGAGDLNGDGYPDVVLGAGYDGGSSEGVAYALSGRNGTVLFTASGDSPGDLFGLSASGLGDVNGDGHADFVVSAADWVSPYVRVISGEEYTASWSNYGPGWPGTHGIPAFTPSNAPFIGEPITFNIGNSRGAATQGTLLVGLTEAYFPTPWDGVLLLVPSFIFSLFIPADGLALPATIPSDATLAGLSLYLQVIEVDPGASKDHSFTRGLELVLGG
ncbi:MAG: FG-GAP-like repeat-containing protein [Planctomycetota bacterium]